MVGHSLGWSRSVSDPGWAQPVGSARRVRAGSGRVLSDSRADGLRHRARAELPSTSAPQCPFFMWGPGQDGYGHASSGGLGFG